MQRLSMQCQSYSTACMLVHEHRTSLVTLPISAVLGTAMSLLDWRVAGKGDIQTGGQSNKGRKGTRQRRSDAEDDDEKDAWAFLAGLDTGDQSWLHFALYSALQQQQ